MTQSNPRKLPPEIANARQKMEATSKEIALKLAQYKDNKEKAANTGAVMYNGEIDTQKEEKSTCNKKCDGSCKKKQTKTQKQVNDISIIGYINLPNGTLLSTKLGNTTSTTYIPECKVEQIEDGTLQFSEGNNDNKEEIVRTALFSFAHFLANAAKQNTLTQDQIVDFIQEGCQVFEKQYNSNI